MNITDFLSLLDGVKGSGNQYSAICPAHDDHSPSLSVSTGKDGKILLQCHAGCEVRDILACMDLQESDLFQDQNAKEDFKRGKGKPVAHYDYTNEKGEVLFQKTRWEQPDGNKSFSWRHKEGGRWVNGRQGKSVLYNLHEVAKADTVYLVEGEKDVETLWTLGMVATSPPDGAKSDWKPQYTEALQGKTVYIIQDNDNPGKAFADKAARALHSVAALVKVIDLTEEWTDLPEKGDASDAYQMTPEQFLFKLNALVTVTQEFDPETVPEVDDEDLSMTCLTDIEEKEADWLIDGYIPRNQITTIAGDGGSGKTTVWCSILADISSGHCPLFLEGTLPFEQIGDPQKVMFFSAEDPAEQVLKAKLRKHGANMSNVFFIDVSDDRFQKVKFDSEFLEKLIKKHRPALVVFDPIQAFIPDRVRMAERNAMRSCMAHLIGLGTKYKCTFILIVHSNKQSGVWGRKRIADSADIWDISRSVMTVGETNEKGTRYISHEKSNYDRPGNTVLFTIDDDMIQFKCYSDKKDKDFVCESLYATAHAPQRDEAKEFILDFLKDGEKPVKELDGMAKAQSISGITLKRAKKALKDEGIIQYRAEGKGKGNGTIYYASLVDERICS